MSLRIHSQTTLKPLAVGVLKEFASTRRVDPRAFIKALNAFENLYNVSNSTIDELINNPKSKYHLLYSLSNAQTFSAEIFPFHKIKSLAV